MIFYNLYRVDYSQHIIKYIVFSRFIKNSNFRNEECTKHIRYLHLRQNMPRYSRIWNYAQNNIRSMGSQVRCLPTFQTFILWRIISLHANAFNSRVGFNITPVYLLLVHCYRWQTAVHQICRIWLSSLSQ